MLVKVAVNAALLRMPPQVSLSAADPITFSDSRNMSIMEEYIVVLFLLCFGACAAVYSEGKPGKALNESLSSCNLAPVAEPSSSAFT